MSWNISEKPSGDNGETLGAPEPLSYVRICDFVTLQASSEATGVNSEMEKDLRVRSSTRGESWGG